MSSENIVLTPMVQVKVFSFMCPLKHGWIPLDLVVIKLNTSNLAISHFPARTKEDELPRNPQTVYLLKSNWIGRLSRRLRGSTLGQNLA